MQMRVLRQSEQSKGIAFLLILLYNSFSDKLEFMEVFFL